MFTHRKRFAVITAQLSCLLAGCASEPVSVAPMPPAKYLILGKARGEACGSFGILTPPLYFVPMGLNTRVQKAQQRALASVPGATSLINVELQDDWYWWILASTRCTTISGDAIKEARK